MLASLSFVLHEGKIFGVPRISTEEKCWFGHVIRLLYQSLVRRYCWMQMYILLYTPSGVVRHQMYTYIPLQTTLKQLQAILLVLHA